LGANMCMRGDNGEILLVEEVLANVKYQKMAYSVIVELIDNCDFENIEFLKGKSEKEISKIKEELQMIRDRYVSNGETYKED